MTKRSRRLGPFAVADLVFVGVLTGTWVLLWGELSAGNLVSGVAVSALLLVVFPLDRDVTVVRHHLRPGAALRLVGAFAWDLGRSSVASARDVLGGSGREQPGVVACPLRVDAPGLVTFLTNLLSLTPGTMPIDVSHSPPVIYLHVLRLDDPEAIRSMVSHFEELAVRALGDDAAVAAVGQPAPPPPHLARRGAS